jgi:hypothetical protein
MDSAILAERVYHARAKLAAAADVLGASMDLQAQVEALRNARSAEADVDAMLKLEATADLLFAISEKMSGTKVSKAAPAATPNTGLTDEAVDVAPEAASGDSTADPVERVKATKRGSKTK